MFICYCITWKFYVKRCLKSMVEMNIFLIEVWKTVWIIVRIKGNCAFTAQTITTHPDCLMVIFYFFRNENIDTQYFIVTMFMYFCRNFKIWMKNFVKTILKFWLDFIKPLQVFTNMLWTWIGKIQCLWMHVDLDFGFSQEMYWIFLVLFSTLF